MKFFNKLNSARQHSTQTVFNVVTAGFICWIVALGAFNSAPKPVTFLLFAVTAYCLSWTIFHLSYIFDQKHKNAQTN